MVGAGDVVSQIGPSANLTELGAGYSPAVRSGEVELFVRLAAPSVAEYCVNEMLAGKPEPDSAAQKSYAATISGEQNAVSLQLAALGARELSRLRAGDNGFRVRVDASQIDALRSIAGVTAVVPVTKHTPSLTNSVPWIGAADVQAMGYDGTGTTIAVIDTGIDYYHAGLGGAGDPADYAADDPNVVEPGTFPTAKVIDGYDFAGPTYNADDPANSTPAPDADPLDGDGHGSHVSGIAAGLGVPGEIGQGVAPGAYLMALKVFGDTAGSTTLTADAIEFALDPNGDGGCHQHEPRVRIRKSGRPVSSRVGQRGTHGHRGCGVCRQQRTNSLRNRLSGRCVCRDIRCVVIVRWRCSRFLGIRRRQWQFRSG
jgi:subtilisin family serine protease